jgi:hypothetical protein
MTDPAGFSTGWPVISPPLNRFRCAAIPKNGESGIER